MIYERQIFSCIHEYPCEFCGSREGVTEYRGEVVCEECKERMEKMGNNPQVNGTLNITLFVDCPKCGESIDLMEKDAENDYVLGESIFGGNFHDYREAGLGYDYICPRCKCEFVLNKVEW